MKIYHRINSKTGPGLWSRLKPYLNNSLVTKFGFVNVLVAASVLLAFSLISPPFNTVLADKSGSVQYRQQPAASPAETPTKADQNPIHGTDVSHYQGNIDWTKIKEAGLTFAYTKATQHVSFKDPQFPDNWESISDAGLARGAYHFYVAGEDPRKQARLFIDHVGKIVPGDLPPMLDLEGNEIENAIDVVDYQKNVFIWLEMVENELLRKPVIYTTHRHGNKYLTDSRFGEYELWIADWEQDESPNIPDVWNGNWAIWQRSDREKVSGVKGPLDHDLFNGNSIEYRQFLGLD